MRARNERPRGLIAQDHRLHGRLELEARGLREVALLLQVRVARQRTRQASDGDLASTATNGILLRLGRRGGEATGGRQVHVGEHASLACQYEQERQERRALVAPVTHR